MAHSLSTLSLTADWLTAQTITVHAPFVVMRCRSGNCGDECRPPATSWGAADDRIVEAVIDEAVFAFAARARSVHFTGFSQGGAMAW